MDGDEVMEENKVHWITCGHKGRHQEKENTRIHCHQKPKLYMEEQEGK